MPSTPHPTRAVTWLAPVAVALLVAAVLVVPSLATSDDAPDDRTREIDRVAAGGKSWSTMKTYKRAKLQACRPATAEGYSHLLVRMNNKHRTSERRVEVWVKDASTAPFWTAAAHSGWAAAGKRKVFARFSSTGDLAKQKVRVKMRTHHGSKRFTYFSWDRVPTC
ncbi:hypothetical protein NOK12_35450 [Nocardioides sp. OK12]|uniref:Uncharacterized protein n=1 Tax=Nocardioides marinisabuli TaxID=419476 RepID=A0A7Y9F3K8_9ACTN|nr:MULTISPECIES: hypothetical protein [Nocardioides]NYD58766.1 hypothetical protein [Nocardioides marinisabuli]GHJ61027.1 hypothetical protein NOK12_35450 [Nocardioides sp. OK12]